MAEKGFGVKEINLIGASGTPTIESPNNLNLNAVNVAISTNVSIGGTLTVTGNVSVGGTLTYEDVTNIDSVGVVTAREGIIIPDNKVLSLGNRLVGSTAGDLRLYHDTNNSYIDEIGSGNLFIRNGSNNSIFCQTSGTVQLYYNGNDKLATSNTGVTVSGTLVATGADINGDIDVDGHTNLDNVSIAGVTTASDNISIVKSTGPILELTTNTNGADSSLRLHEGTAGSTTNGGGMYYSGANNKLYITCGTTLTTERITIDRDTGNVAIANDLDVDGTTNLDNVDIVGITTIRNASGTKLYEGVANGSKLFHAGTERLSTELYGIDINGTLGADQVNCSGVVTATSFSGSGANLTGIAVTEAPVVDYTITGDGSHYYFHGGGVDETAGDPDLYLIRGQKYRFNNTTGSGHPFRFTSTGNANAAYSNGVTGSENGIQFWTIPYDAPAKLFYVCTIHSGMVGNIYIRGANGQNDNVGVTTFSGNVTINDGSGEGSLKIGGTNTGTGGTLFYEISGSTYLRIKNLYRSNSSNGNSAYIEYDAGYHKFLAGKDGNEKMRLTSGGDILLGAHGSRIFDDSSGTNVVVDIYGGTTAGKRGILALGGRTGSDNADIGTIQFLNENNGNATSSSHAQSKLVASIDTKSETTTNNSGANSGGHLIFSTKAENAALTERARITSDGYLIKAAGRSCAFNVRGTNMSRTDTSGYICQFNDDTSTGCFDSGNNFNTSSYKFIAPVTGTYYFFTNIRLDQYSTGYIRTAFLSTNYGTGSTFYNYPETGHVISYPTNNNIMHISTSTVVQLDKDDELYVWQNPSADTSYTVYLSESSFGGYLIG